VHNQSAPLIISIGDNFPAARAGKKLAIMEAPNTKTNAFM
jgi:hypothetical protein